MYKEMLIGLKMVYYKLPQVVANIFADNDAWWEYGQRSTMAQFLSNYTLHDSYWVDIRFSHTGTCQAIVHFDSLYNEAERKSRIVPFQADIDQKNFQVNDPYLCINFSNVHQILSDHSQKYVIDYVVNYASTKLLTDEERTSWFEAILKLSAISKDSGEFLLDDGIHCTTFEGTGHNHVHFIHNEPTFFMVVGHEGTILQLSDLKIE